MLARFSAFLIVFSITITSALAQSQPEFKKQNFNYSEWTKGKFSEAVTVTNAGKFDLFGGYWGGKRSRRQDTLPR